MQIYFLKEVLSIPLVYELDQDLIPIKHYYLGDQEKISDKIKSVANQGKSR